MYAMMELLVRSEKKCRGGGSDHLSQLLVFVFFFLIYF